MPNWDDYRGYRADRDRDRERDRWREDERRERRGYGAERRPLEDERGRFNSDEARYAMRGGRGEGEREPWRRDRYGPRVDQDRSWYGAGYGYARGGADRGLEDEEGRFSGYAYAGGEPLSYAGQEYGIEGHGAGGGGGHGHPSFSDQRHPDHDLDPDYLHWREEQLRAHDRDYQEWRSHQHRQYDEDYRKFRTERREQFGRTFHHWRTQRSTVGGVPDTTVAPGVGGYGDKSAIGGGYNVESQARPSGGADAPAGHLSADTAMSQTGGAGASGGQKAGPGAAPGPEFGREPPQVKAASEGRAQDDKPH